MTRQRGRLTREQQELCAPYVPLAYYEARKVWLAFSRVQADFDELKSEALVKLTEAAYFHDPSKGDFSSFARAYIFNQLRGVQGNLNKRRKAHGIQPLDPMATWDRSSLSEKLQEKLSWVLDSLSSLRPRWREALGGLYGLGGHAKRLKDLALDMGITHSGVQNNITRGVRFLRDKYLREKST